MLLGSIEIENAIGHDERMSEYSVTLVLFDEGREGR